MTIGENKLKPNKQAIKELEIERDEIKNKNKAAGQMISNGTLDNEHNLLLSMQMSAYKTVTHVLNARIRLLEKQMSAIEEPKKFNVQVPGIKDRFYYRNGENYDILSIFGAAGNRDSSQQFTLEQIEKFKLQDCPRFEVANVNN